MLRVFNRFMESIFGFSLLIAFLVMFGTLIKSGSNVAGGGMATLLVTALVAAPFFYSQHRLNETLRADSATGKRHRAVRFTLIATVVLTVLCTGLAMMPKVQVGSYTTSTGEVWPVMLGGGVSLGMGIWIAITLFLFFAATIGGFLFMGRAQLGITVGTVVASLVVAGTFDAGGVLHGAMNVAIPPWVSMTVAVVWAGITAAMRFYVLQGTDLSDLAASTTE